ncbi:MAG: ATP-grasp domain-containing protein [Planctomycetota bacterium]
MRVFVYEWVTGGGLLGESGEELAKLKPEGDAMAGAVAEDLAAAGVAVTVLRDDRLASNAPASAGIVRIASPEEHAREFDRLCQACDATLLIAPEFDGVLLNAARRAERIGTRLISPSSRFIEATFDKHKTCDRLAESGVATTRGTTETIGDRPPVDLRFPCVVKPLDGAGSLGCRLVRGPEDWRRLGEGPHRVEALAPGLAASVAVIGGPAGLVAAPAMTQRLASDDTLGYLGGESIVDSNLKARAQRLALKAIAACPPLHGYAGVDLVLGDDASGSQDVFVEINPRLTTSYCGLRRAVAENLAGVMLAACEGRAATVTPTGQAVSFDATGRVRDA